MKDRNTAPKVSIIIPVYNTGKYLEECLDNVVHQTYSNIEIVCINDGSTDDSSEILKRYSARDDRMKIISQENSGVVTARNNGISQATGEYILAIDSDDIVAKDIVKKLLAVIIDSEYDIVLPKTECFGAVEGEYVMPEPTAQNMANQNCIVSTCGMYRKESWVKYGGYDTRFDKGMEDYDFWWNFFQDVKKAKKIDEILFYYRVKERTESRNMQTLKHHNKLVKLMLKKYPLMKQLRTESVYVVPSLPIKVYRFAKRKSRGVIKRTRVVKKIITLRQYKDYVLNQQLDKTDFVPITKKPYSHSNSKKLVAYYLPQYYEIEQNNEWFGRGFTEWTNTSKAVPQYTGHWQPHIPIDVGYYNLETSHVMHRQVELAEMYGVSGFCFYYYWFSGGEKIMEKPVNNYLNDKKLNLPFMFFWANEDWTNTWGEKADIGTKTFSAKMKPSDVKKFVDDIEPFIKDSRYITVDGRPHIIIYQAKKDPYLKTFIQKIGDLIKKRGIARPYISLVFPDDSPATFNPFDYGADAAVEFGVHMKVRPDHIQKPISTKHFINDRARMTAWDMNEFIDGEKFLYDTDYPVYRSAMTNFDSTARKIFTNAFMFSLTPDLYKKWLSKIIKTTDRDTVFLTAWNEWAEGMHLEPDSRYGYAYLQATKEALEDSEVADGKGRSASKENLKRDSAS